jgi:hypothetical protein
MDINGSDGYRALRRHTAPLEATAAQDAAVTADRARKIEEFST